MGRHDLFRVEMLAVSASLLALFAVVAVHGWEYGHVYGYDPVANNATMVVNRNVRITVLTGSLLRLEERYEDQQGFDDRATLSVVNRKLDETPKFRVSTTLEGGLRIETEQGLVLEQNGAGLESVRIYSRIRERFAREWKFGDLGLDANLHGTIRSLDTLGPISLDCSGLAGKTMVHLESLHCTNGLISRLGWAIHDDTETPRFIDGWWDILDRETKRPKHDIYFFGHGIGKYKASLSDYRKIGGNIPLIPRSLVGIWWTRWYQYDGIEILQTIREFENYGLPLDNIVLDMNWHIKNAWGAYTFDSNLWPFPKQQLGAIHDSGISSIFANLHDADGVKMYEDQYYNLARYMNLSQPYGDIPFQVCTNESYAYGVEDVVLEALRMDGRGFDQWWIDFQQGSRAGGCLGKEYNPTMWLNHIRSTYSIRHRINKRDAILSRWGGLGSHRYPVGFSGDVDLLTWSRLAYQPYFTMTAANVLYGFWSHDIGGPSRNPELHVRWVQFGVFSPIFRYHDRGQSAGALCNYAYPPDHPERSFCEVVRPWRLPERFFSAVRTALHLRVALVPYIYNFLYFETWENGLSLIRPLYYEYPNEPMAYAANLHGDYPQYLFGDQILVSPIVKPAKMSGLLVEQRIWIPPPTEAKEKWYDIVNGRVYSGPKNLTLAYDLEEIPIFIKAGSIIPELTNTHGIGVAAQEYKDITFAIYPGADTGTSRLYHDDGISMRYLHEKQPNVSTVKYTAHRAGMTIEGSLATDLERVRFKLVDTPKPSKLSQGYWSFDPISLHLLVTLENMPRGKFMLEIEFATTQSFVGLRGKIRRLRAAKRILDQVRKTPPCLAKAASFTPACLEYTQNDSEICVQGLNEAISQSIEHVKALCEIEINPIRKQAVIEMLGRELGELN